MHTETTSREKPTPGAPNCVVVPLAFHRFSTNGKHGDDSCWYVLHTDGLAARSFSWCGGAFCDRLRARIMALLNLPTWEQAVLVADAERENPAWRSS